jgi:hypothetical protein
MRRRRFLTTIASVALMALFGYAVWAVLGTLQTKGSTTLKPTAEKALVDLPGTVAVVQGGHIYSLSNLQFTELDTSPGDWVQAAPAPSGDLLGVVRGNGYSNVYLLNSQGQTIRTLLNETSTQFFDNHFAFYPRVSANGQSLFYAWNWVDPDANYYVDFEILAVPLANTSANPTDWSTPNEYQGGDVEPVPLANGGMIYSKYAVNSQTGATYSQLVYMSSANASQYLDDLDYLTSPAQNCSEAAINPAGNTIAMICTDNLHQSTTLDVATWNGTSLGPLRVVSNGPLAASPTWAPTGNSLLFLQPVKRNEPFQLWWLPDAASAKPGAVQQVTENLNLTATSAPVWTS